MPVRSDITGLTEVGATAQTIALARVLYEDADSRETVKALLNLFERPTEYSNQDSDRMATTAAVLATIIRKYSGPEIN